MANSSELSSNARHVLGAVFGWNSVLMYHNIESVPSPEMQEILDELVAAGMLKAEVGMDDMPAHGQAVRYRVSEGVDLDSYRREAGKGVFDGSAPSIRVAIKKVDASMGPRP